MPFYEGFEQIGYGLWWWFFDTYCQTDTAASDYGKCYQRFRPPYANLPLFTYTGTAAPSCVSDGTCIGVQNPPWEYIITLKDNTSVGKQLVLYKTWVILNSNCSFEPNIRCGRVTVKTNAMQENLWFPFIFKTANYASDASPNVYNPLDNSVCGLNVFYKPPVGYEVVTEWSGATLAMKIITYVHMANFANKYYAFYAAAYYAQETSPFAIIPLDYDKSMCRILSLGMLLGFL